MIAEVMINRNVRELNKIFDYHIPVNMEEQVKIGSRILVPFGRGKILEEGFVVGIKECSEYEIKDIAKVEEICISREKIELSKWMSNRYFCNVSDCIKFMLPPRYNK